MIGSKLVLEEPLVTYRHRLLAAPLRRTMRGTEQVG